VKTSWNALGVVHTPFPVGTPADTNALVDMMAAGYGSLGSSELPQLFGANGRNTIEGEQLLGLPAVQFIKLSKGT